MQLRKYRWSKDYESAEEELIDLLSAKDIAAERWAAHEGEDIAAHRTDRDLKIWCAEGMAMVEVDGKSISIQPGDALDLPVGTTYAVRIRLGGCVCYQAYL